MTKRLEELFNLESADVAAPVEEKPPVATHDEINSLDDSYRAVQEITRSLPQIQELDSLDDKELDDLAKKAEAAYDDLMDLGMNVEARYGARMFEVAGNMLNAAITAKSAKIDKKLKMVELQLKKYAVDKKEGNANPDSVQAEGVLITDRNSLIAKLKNLDK